MANYISNSELTGENTSNNTDEEGPYTKANVTQNKFTDLDDSGWRVKQNKRKRRSTGSTGNDSFGKLSTDDKLIKMRPEMFAYNGHTERHHYTRYPYISEAIQNVRSLFTSCNTRTLITY